MQDQMKEIQERKRQLWEKQKAEQAAQAASSSSSSAAPAAASSSQATADPPSASSSSGGASAAAAPPAADAAASATGELPFVKRLHVLPLGRGALESGKGMMELLSPELRAKRSSKDLVCTGQLIRASNHEFVVVKAEPDEGYLNADTDYYVDGDPVVHFQKVQFMCLWDYESSRGPRQDNSTLFSDYIGPYFRSIADGGVESVKVISINDQLPIFDLTFQMVAAETADFSPPGIGFVDADTMVFVDWDTTPEFEKIHVVPFEDTLPQAYQYDIFSEYLKPYLTKHKFDRFKVNDTFKYQGVQFKVVCCEPVGPARIGRNTTIYCEGVLHPSLRNLLPPELLEQLSHLPPGLQMLLLNTEGLSGEHEDRLIEVQDMLNNNRGMSPEAIGRLEQFKWGEPGRREQEAQSTCMVCLEDFADGDDVRKLPCSHVFHAGCVDEWLRRCTVCPICKANVDRPGTTPTA